MGASDGPGGGRGGRGRGSGEGGDARRMFQRALEFRGWGRRVGRCRERCLKLLQLHWTHLPKPESVSGVAGTVPSGRDQVEEEEEEGLYLRLETRKTAGQTTGRAVWRLWAAQTPICVIVCCTFAGAGVRAHGTCLQPAGVAHAINTFLALVLALSPVADRLALFCANNLLLKANSKRAP